VIINTTLPSLTLLLSPQAGLILGWRWKEDMSVMCYQGSHAILIWVVGIPGLVFVAFLCPFVTAWHLARNHSQLDEPKFLAK